MMPDFNANPTPHRPADDRVGGMSDPAAPTNDADRAAFDRLSAYLDGEASEGERRQVEARLETDPETRRQLARLQALRSRLHRAPVPEAVSPEATLAGVFDRVDRRRRRWTLWGGSALAATCVGLLATATALWRGPAYQMADRAGDDPIAFSTQPSPLASPLGEDGTEDLPITERVLIVE